MLRRDASLSVYNVMRRFLVDVAGIEDRCMQSNLLCDLLDMRDERGHSGMREEALHSLRCGLDREEMAGATVGCDSPLNALWSTPLDIFTSGHCAPHESSDNGPTVSDSHQSGSLSTAQHSWDDGVLSLIIYVASYVSWSRRVAKCRSSPSSAELIDNDGASDAAFYEFLAYTYAIGAVEKNDKGATVDGCRCTVKPVVPEEILSALRAFLPYLPSGDELRRQPSLIAAVETLAETVWSVQVCNHDPSSSNKADMCRRLGNGGTWTPDNLGDSGNSLIALRCPLCYAAAIDHVLGVEAVLCLVELYAVLQTKRATTVSPPWRHRFSEEDRGTREEALRTSSRGVPSAQQEGVIAQNTQNLTTLHNADEGTEGGVFACRRSRQAAAMLLWTHVQAVCRIGIRNANTRVVQRVVWGWVFSCFASRLFPGISEPKGRYPSQRGGAMCQSGPSSLCSVSLEEGLQFSYYDLLLSQSCLLMQDTMLFQHLTGDPICEELALRQSDDSFLSEAQELHLMDEDALLSSLHCLHAVCLSSEKSISAARCKLHTSSSSYVGATVERTFVGLLIATPYVWLGGQVGGGATVLQWAAGLGYTMVVRTILHWALRALVGSGPSGTVDGAVSGALALPLCQSVLAPAIRRISLKTHSPSVPPDSPKTSTDLLHPSLPQHPWSTCPTLLFPRLGHSLGTACMHEAIRGHSHDIVRLLLLFGASVYANELPLEEWLATTVVTVPGRDLGSSVDAKDVLRLLYTEGDSLGRTDTVGLQQRLSKTLSASAAASLLAQMAERLWSEKVQHMFPPHAHPSDDSGSWSVKKQRKDAWKLYWAAQDRVVRLVLASLAYDSAQPVARIVLLSVLGRKVEEFIGRGEEWWCVPPMSDGTTVNDDVTWRREWSRYDAAVLRMYGELSSASGMEILRDAVRSRYAVCQVNTRYHQQQDVEALNTSDDNSMDSGGGEEKKCSDCPGKAESTRQVEYLLQGFHKVVEQRQQIHAQLRQKTDAMCIASDVRSDPFLHIHSERGAADQGIGGSGGMSVAVACDESQPGVPAYVLVNFSKDAFLRGQSQKEAPVAAALMALAPRDRLQQLWVRLPALMDFDRTLAEHGGAYAVVEDVPLLAPVQRGDLVVFMLNRQAMRFDVVEVLSPYAREELYEVREHEGGGGHSRWGLPPSPHRGGLVVQLPCILKEETVEDEERVPWQQHADASPVRSSAASRGERYSPALGNMPPKAMTDRRAFVSFPPGGERGWCTLRCLIVTCAHDGLDSTADDATFRPLVWLEDANRPCDSGATSSSDEGTTDLAGQGCLPHDIITSLISNRELVQRWTHVMQGGSQVLWVHEVYPVAASAPACPSDAPLWMRCFAGYTSVPDCLPASVWGSTLLPQGKHTLEERANILLFAMSHFPRRASCICEMCRGRGSLSGTVLLLRLLQDSSVHPVFENDVKLLMAATTNQATVRSDLRLVGVLPQWGWGGN